MVFDFFWILGTSQAIQKSTASHIIYGLVVCLSSQTEKCVHTYKLCTKCIINQSKTFIEWLHMVRYGTSWYMVIVLTVSIGS